MREKRELTVLVVFAALLMLGVILCNVLTAPVSSDLVISYPSTASGLQNSQAPSVGEETSAYSPSESADTQTNTADETGGKVSTQQMWRNFAACLGLERCWPAVLSGTGRNMGRIQIPLN